MNHHVQITLLFFAMLHGPCKKCAVPRSTVSLGLKDVSTELDALPSEHNSTSGCSNSEMFGCYVAYMGWGGRVNVHVKCIRCRCYVAYMGWGGHVNVHVKCIRCQKNFASHLEYSTVVPGCHAHALAALCMDVVLETQDLE